MTMQCENACALVPSYLDGELSEEQAGPLRRHLLDCLACREVAQGEQAMKRWFVAEEPMTVPSGFAARVARRAFAGDTGVLPEVEVTPVPAANEGKLLTFVMRMTVVAAAILFVFAVAIRQERLPEGSGLSADETTWQNVREELDELNAEDEAESVEEDEAGE